MNQYKLTGTGYVIRLADNMYIPLDSDSPEAMEYQAWLAEGNTPDPAFTFAEICNQKRSEINNAYSDASSVLSQGYPPNEQKTWPVQIMEAHIVLNNLNEETPWIDAASQQRLISKQELAAKIRQMDYAYRALSGMLTGKRQRLIDQINALEADNDEDGIANISWS